MFWNRKKKKVKFKRPDYYPKCNIYYGILLKDEKIIGKDEYIEVSYVEYQNHNNLYCCKGFEKLFETYPQVEVSQRRHKGKYEKHNHHLTFKVKNYLEKGNEVPMWYCPFCGAKIKLKRCYVDREIKVKETVEKFCPERTIKTVSKKKKRITLETHKELL